MSITKKQSIALSLALAALLVAGLLWLATAAGCAARAEGGTLLAPLPWAQVNSDGFGSNNKEASSMAIFDGYLYVGTYYLFSGAEVWRSPDGAAWEQANAGGFADANNAGAPAMAVFSDTLYLGISTFTSGAEIWRTADGTTWEQVNIDGFGDGDNSLADSMAIFDGYLYVGCRNSTSGAEVWRSPGGSPSRSSSVPGSGWLCPAGREIPGR